jgi:hypothetical protein
MIVLEPLRSAVNLLNTQAVKSGVKTVTGVLPCLFGVWALYDTYLLMVWSGMKRIMCLGTVCVELQKSRWLMSIKKMGMLVSNTISSRPVLHMGNALLQRALS